MTAIKTAVCAHCGKAFVPQNKHTRYCSARCRKAVLSAADTDALNEEPKE